MIVFSVQIFSVQMKNCKIKMITVDYFVRIPREGTTNLFEELITNKLNTEH
jgi:hypothetical protein